jgi:Molydopterin dinucleotide binding domain
VRWQEREAASALSVEELSTEPLPVPPAPDRGLRLAAVPTLWTGPEVEHSPSLRFLSTRARAEISVDDAREAGIANGDEVSLSVNGVEATAVASVRSAVPAGSVFVSGASLPEGPLALSRAGEAVAAG